MKRDSLSTHSAGLLAGFFVQFLGGMTLNLFIKLPASVPGASSPNYFVRSIHSLGWAFSGSGGSALTIHAYLALALLLGSISLLIRGTIEHDQRWTIIGAIAAIFTLGAALFGLNFITNNQVSTSMIMAVCWLIAVSALVMGLGRKAVALGSHA